MNKTTLTAVILIIIIIAGIGLYMFRGGGGATQASTTTMPPTTTTAAGGKGLPNEIPIGLAIAVSGGYSVDGPRRLKGALLAIEEMNKLLEQANAPFRFKPIHEDTKTSPQEAVNVIKRFASQGIQVIIGPLSTSETAAVMPIANEKHIVVISPSSTGKAAAFPNDYVFRMPPPDTAQGPAIARLIHKLGYTKLVIIARNDDYGKGLADLVEQTYKSLGGQVQKILYQPDKPDLSQEVNSLATAVSKFGADNKTAVLLIAFDNDGMQIIERASQISVLTQVKWFGPDSLGRKTFLESSNIAEFLAKVHIFITTPAIPDNPVKKHFEEAYKAKYGEAPTPYAYYAYDAAWVAMLSVLTAGHYDGAAIKAVLPTVAFHFMGATGYKILDDNGDAAIANYAIVTVVKTASGYSFQQVGILNGATGEIQWQKS